LVGDRYDGKTWCVFDWILNSYSHLLPVFFIPSTQGDGEQQNVDEVLRKLIQKTLGISPDRADALFQRFTSTRYADRPWGIVILDGINEYVLDPAAPDRHLTDLLAERLDTDRRSALVITTVREATWVELLPRLEGRVKRISICPFDDRELADALTLAGVYAEDFGALSPSAQQLARRPRFFQLWATIGTCSESSPR
jgi:hypothetical protein